MTREEVKKLIMIIQATYPNWNIKNKQETLDAWAFFLEDYEYNSMMMALKTYISSADSGFAPSVSQLISMARKPQELTQADEGAIWREIRPCIRRGIYHAEEDFEKLSPMAKKVVGQPSQLREWAMLESEVIDSVIQSNMKTRIKDIQRRDLEISAMPIEIQTMIQNTIEMKNN